MGKEYIYRGNPESCSACAKFLALSKVRVDYDNLVTIYGYCYKRGQEARGYPIYLPPDEAKCSSFEPAAKEGEEKA